MDQPLSFAEIVQPILAEERRLELLPRDIALLATIKDEIERSPDGLLTIPYSAIQGLSGRIDLLDVKDPQKAERRMSESMTRFLNAGCLTKAEIDPCAIEALPAFKRQKAVTGMLNRRNWNAAAGLGPKHEPQIAPTATLTRDWALRFRPNKGLCGVFDDKDVDFHEMAVELTECVLPERMWLRFKGFSGKLPKLAVTCENLGAYVDLPIPETVIVIYSPGADIEAAAALIKCLSEVQWFHFGDIDPDGLKIGESLAKETGRKLNLFIPSFAEEYLPGRPVKRPWHKSPDSSLFKELRRTQKRIFQEVFMLDPRLGPEIDAMAQEM